MIHDYTVLIGIYYVNKYMSKVWLDQLVLGVLLHCSNWLCVLFLSITDGKQRRGPAEVTVWMLNRSWHLSNDALMMGNELSAHACVKKPKKAPHVSDYPAQARSIGGDATQHPYAYYLLSCCPLGSLPSCERKLILLPGNHLNHLGMKLLAPALA